VEITEAGIHLQKATICRNYFAQSFFRAKFEPEPKAENFIVFFSKQVKAGEEGKASPAFFNSSLRRIF
jgi:hypothetical protein